MCGQVTGTTDTDSSYLLADDTSYYLKVKLYETSEDDSGNDMCTQAWLWNGSSFDELCNACGGDREEDVGAVDLYEEQTYVTTMWFDSFTYSTSDITDPTTSY